MVRMSAVLVAPVGLESCRLRASASRHRLLRALQWSARLLVNDLVPSVSPSAPPSPALTSAIRRRAKSAAVRAKYHDAWILIDRDVSAQDNAEAFYRHLRDHVPEVNAWFALSRESPDWPRLHRDGFRLLEFGSINYALALRNAAYLLSSQADDYIVRPPQPLSGPRRWKFVFLQHGVIHNDLSRWLNNQPVRVMITTTEAEHRSIVGDGSPYVLSDKEVARTGLPRHDRLLELSRRGRNDQRAPLLIAPTWRQHLLAAQGSGHRRELAVDLPSSSFMTAWRRFLADPALHRLAGRERLELVFLAHPHLQHHITAAMLPTRVRLVTAADADVQQILATARLLVTDYSSLAFDVAYLGAPVVYFQFDAPDFFSGNHTVQAGDFSYERDGFGPVVTDQEAALAAVESALSDGSPSQQEYRRRADRAFTFRDGRCSERVYEASRNPPNGISDNQSPARLNHRLYFGAKGPLPRHLAEDAWHRAGNNLMLRKPVRQARHAGLAAPDGSGGTWCEGLEASCCSLHGGHRSASAGGERASCPRGQRLRPRAAGLGRTARYRVPVPSA